ncbi:Uncharacterised protein [Acinetobacter baumannii]|jgi:hypothetical protein|nr:Uncharacterised protein [Acinetobacter baumannii]
MMFLKQNTYNKSFSCEPCEWSCEPFKQIIHTLKALHTNAYNNHVNDVNHFLARARERKKHLLLKLNQFKSNIVHNLNTSENTLTRENTHKSFTSFTCNTIYCFYSCFYVNHVSKSFTQSFTSFTWNFED